MMIPSELLSIIGRRHFMAEIRTESAKQALGAVDALARGGIAVFEISLAIPGASEILRHYAANMDVMVGAGGVLDLRQAEDAAKAGAKFITTPIMVPELVRGCAENHITCMLGALTPTEILMAQRAGTELVKVFPVSAMGGAQYIRSLFRQFTHLSLMVAGGITMETLPDYLALPVRAIALGSTLTPRALVERSDWASMTQIARRYVEYANAWEAAGGGTPSATANGRPTLPDTMMAPVPNMARSQPPMHGPTPTASQPAIAPPGAPAATPSFNSKPAGPGEDWIR